MQKRHLPPKGRIAATVIVLSLAAVGIEFAGVRSEALDWLKALGPWVVGIGGFAFGYWNTNKPSDRADARVKLQLEHDSKLRKEERTAELLAERERLARVLFGEAETNLSLMRHQSTFDENEFWSLFFDRDTPFTYTTMLSDSVRGRIGVLSTETAVVVQDYYSRMREFEMLKLVSNTGRVTADDIKKQVESRKPQRIFSNLRFSTLQLRASLAIQLPDGDPAAAKVDTYWDAAKRHAEEHFRLYNEKPHLFSFEKAL